MIISKAHYEKRLLRVLEYIFDNLDGDLSLDALADVACMSRFHWHRVFYAMTGETVAATIRRVRLSRASGYLLQTDIPIAQVAERTGYPSIQSFSRAFKGAFNMSPGTYRTSGRAPVALEFLQKDDFEMFPVRTEDKQDVRLVGQPHTGNYMNVGSAFEAAVAVFTARNLWPFTQAMVGVYYDDPDMIEEDKLRSFAGFHVNDALELPDGMKEEVLEGGRYAVLTHKGPYAELHRAYRFLFGQWLPQSGAEAKDAPCYEVYLNNPRDVAPDELLTEICLPLK